MGVFSRKSKTKSAQALSGGSLSKSSSDIASAISSDRLSCTASAEEKEDNEQMSKSMSTESKTKVMNGQTEPTLNMLPDLISNLGTSDGASGEEASRSLRFLFALSEHSTGNKEFMVESFNGTLVPTLLKFLSTCDRNSSEHYLALLILNNVSIPEKNKRAIAIHHGGASILCRLLCEDPSCHLIAIILVNLTFADAKLRKELVSPSLKIELVYALAYVLWVSSSKYSADQSGSLCPLVFETNNNLSPHQLALRSIKTDNQKGALGQIRFPETARWCLCALKNLTRASKDSSAAYILVNTGIVPLILRIVTVGSTAADITPAGDDSHSTGKTPEPSEPGPVEDSKILHHNNPSLWDSNSIQDAALFLLLNIASISEGSDYLGKRDTIDVLSKIAESLYSSKTESTSKNLNQHRLQCVKARMALACMVGSGGHYGQPSLEDEEQDLSVLTIKGDEAEFVVDVLSNTLHQRSKEGPGGYSAATFTIKSLLHAIRALLARNSNQITFANMAGMKLACLLLKALAQYSVQHKYTLDTADAEQACFSLYLLSNHGLKDSSFMPQCYGRLEDYRSDESGAGESRISMHRARNETSLVGKVLYTYKEMEKITPAGYHSADQILMRLPYLNFNGKIGDIVTSSGCESDFVFDESLIQEIRSLQIYERDAGEEPLEQIFDRPILRSRVPKKGSKAPWNSRQVTTFPNALVAAQKFSFGSSKVRHMDAIDVILIANNIANSANGEKRESYRYWWSWKDTAQEIQNNLGHTGASTNVSILNGLMKYIDDGMCR